MILNFDRGYGQSAEQMIQSLMESTQTALDTMERKLKDAGINISGNQEGQASIVDIVYPVGAIYMSMEATNPSKLFGGLWERIGVGRMLISAGGGNGQVIDDNTYKGRGQTTGITADVTFFPVGETGGELDHTLSVKEIPSHSHDAKIGSKDVFASGKVAGYKAATGEKITGSTGGDSKHNNVPPYLSVYMWKRTE